MQGIEEFAPEQTGERADGKEERFTGMPSSSQRINPAAWDDTVKVRMVAEILAPGMENGSGSDLSAEMLGVAGNAITRLYYCESYRVGSSVLPQAEIREQLRSLNGMVLLDARAKMRDHSTGPIKNTTGYLMTCLLNSICEIHSDVMVDF